MFLRLNYLVLFLLHIFVFLKNVVAKEIDYVRGKKSAWTEEDTFDVITTDSICARFFCKTNLLESLLLRLKLEYFLKITNIKYTACILFSSLTIDVQFSKGQTKQNLLEQTNEFVFFAVKRKKAKMENRFVCSFFWENLRRTNLLTVLSDL